jgi:arginase
VTIQRPGPFRDTASSSAAVNRVVAECVSDAMEAGRLPIVLSGSCVTSHGVLAGFDHSDCGAVWLDAHADFNTPDSTKSGFLPGMSLAIVTGHCYADYWAEIGHHTPLAEETVALLGVRDFSPEAERERLRQSAINFVQWRGGGPQGDVPGVIDAIARRVRNTYLHVDFDSFDPAVAPGVADEPVPGGLSRDDAESIVRTTAGRLRIRAATLATYAPARDRDDKTLKLGLWLIALIAESAAQSPR